VKRALFLAALLGGCVLASAAHAAAADGAALLRGEQIYGRCLACHAIEQNRTGPAHCGLFGRRAGSAPGYRAYSDALRKSGIVWNEKTLDHFLANPMGTVPGTNMTYLGVTSPQERSELIAWMKQATQPGKSCKPAD
jgi:cytochrome c